MLPEEEPRAVSPLAKKRSPKRRIEFKSDEQKRSIGPPLSENSSDDGATSWADMVKNGYQRPSNTNGAHNIVKSKENDNNSLSKQKKHIDHKESSNKSTSDSSVENYTAVISSKLNKETNIELGGLDATQESSNSSFSSTAAEVINFHNKMSPCCDKKSLDAANMEEDEGWEVVSRSRGKPSRKGFCKVQSTISTAYTFPISSDVSNYASEEEKESYKQSHDENDHDTVDLGCHGDGNAPGSHGDGDPDHDDIDPDHHDDIDPQQQVQHHHGNGDNDPDDAENFCGGDKWWHQDKAVVKDSDIADEENREVDSLVSNIDIDRVISPDLQVSA